MLAGVAAGVARSLGLDPVIVRVAFLVLALAGGAGMPLYVAGWLLIPDEESGESLAAQLIQSVWQAADGRVGQPRAVPAFAGRRSVRQLGAADRRVARARPGRARRRPPSAPSQPA